MTKKKPGNPAPTTTAENTHSGWSPRAFLKAERPEQFSDSQEITTSKIDQRYLEYILDTLTNRKEEIDFENFCRKLAEREICANLMPQTGPTGGGDSKADTRTYPVAPSLSLRAYWGTPVSDASEHWCFAFSAKKAWREKVKSDVRGLSSSGIRPTRIFFMTSQFAKDKSKSEVELQLQNEVGVPVTVLDRAWIVEKVIEHNHTDLLTSYLHVSLPGQGERRTGPNDLTRRKELDELLQKFKDPYSHYYSDHNLIEDYFHAIVLSREIEAPVHEVEGLIAQVDRLTKGCGTVAQQARLHYTKAWTLFWWYDKVGAVEPGICWFIDNLNKITEHEVLNQLIALIYLGAARLKDEPALRERILAWGTAATDRLSQLSSNGERPSNALACRTIKALFSLGLGLILRKDDVSRTAEHIAEIRACLKESRGHVYYPTMDFIRDVLQLGEMMGASSDFDELFDDARRVASDTAGEQFEGKMLLRRAEQLHTSGDQKQALARLGEARRKIVGNNEIALLLRVAHLSTSLYESLELWWAARAESLFGLSLAASDVVEFARSACFFAWKLMWLELRLGRIPMALAFSSAHSHLSDHLDKNIRDLVKDEHVHTFDGVLSLFFVLGDLEFLRHCVSLPNVLAHLGLMWSRAALLFALGHRDLLKNEGAPPDMFEEDNNSCLWKHALFQPALADVSVINPTLHLSGDMVNSSCKVFGTEIVITHSPDHDLILFADNIRATLEAWFATATFRDFMLPYAKLELYLECKPDTLERVGPEISSSQPPGARAIVSVPIGATKWSREVENQPAVRNCMLSILIWVMGHSVKADVDTVDEVMKRLDDHASYPRSMDWTPLAVHFTNVIPIEMTAFTAWQNGQEFAVLRSQEWWRGTFDVRAIVEDALRKRFQAESVQHGGSVDAIRAAFEAEYRHRRARVLDLIDLASWRKAGWYSMLYMCAPGEEQPPILGFVFKDRNAAEEVFAQLKNRVGEKDEAGEIRVSIVADDNSLSYFVRIGPDVIGALQAAGDASGVTLVTAVTKDQVFTCTNVVALRAFVEEHLRLGCFCLAPAFSSDGKTEILFDSAILAKNFRFMFLSELSKDDDDWGSARRHLLTAGHSSEVTHPERRSSRAIKKSRPNEPCACGSGKKYKKCCGRG